MIKSTEKLERARNLIAEKKRQLAEKIQRRNEEKRITEKKQEIEKQKQQLEEWRKARGLKPKPTVSLETKPIQAEESPNEEEEEIYLDDFHEQGSDSLLFNPSFDSVVDNHHHRNSEIINYPYEGSELAKSDISYEAHVSELENSFESERIEYPITVEEDPLTPETIVDETGASSESSVVIDTGNSFDRAFLFEISAEMKVIKRTLKVNFEEQEQKRQELKEDLLEKVFYKEETTFENFETFGKKQLEEEPPPFEMEEYPSPPLYEIDKKPKFLVVEDTGKTKYNEKVKQLEERSMKREEELEQKKVARRSPSPAVTKKTVKPPVKEKEETRNDIKNKYKRHKNLPNLIMSKPSNKKIIKNAITNVCIAGEPNKIEREEVLKIVDNASTSYLIIVFKSELGRRDFGGMYSHDPNTGEVLKIAGPHTFPEVLVPAMVKIYFRYDSGAREFKVLQCKDFIIGTDAVVLHYNPKQYS